MKKKILYISMSLPYDTVPHAGGKVLNYYIKRYAAEYDVTLIAKVLPGEEKKGDELPSSIQVYPIQTPTALPAKLMAYFTSINSKFNPLYKHGNVLTRYIFKEIEKKLKELKADGYQPDAVILEWTWMVLFVETVKSIFPDAVYIGSEHDVSFLGLERQFKQAKPGIKKAYNYLYFRNIRARELHAAEICDLIVTYNEKDKHLLTSNGIEADKVTVLSPYFDRIEAGERRPNNRDILFYGAMNREENHLSAMWFIHHVLPRLNDLDVRFVVLGNKPKDELLELASDRVIVTGFVEDITPWFSSAMCMAAPLQLGAGIKIKILEAMGCGIPVLTNDIGIEGIDAVDGVDYLHCISASDFESKIRQIHSGGIDVSTLSVNATEIVARTYDLDKSYIRYRESILSAINKKKN